MLSHTSTPDATGQALAIQHAAAHPYQGWRERYRNNQKWIDERIEVWLDRHSWVRERGGDFPRAIGHERTLRAKPSVKSTTTPRKRKAAEPQTSEREENEDEDEDEDLIHPPGRSPNKRQRRQTVGEKGAEAPATEGAAQEDVRAPIDGDADVRPLRRAVPHSTAPSEPPPTYRTAVQLSSPAGKGRRGLAVPKYRQATSLPDGDWPPPRMTKGTVEIQMPTSPITPRERSQAPEPPTPHSPPVARSTPRGAPSVSPVLLRAPIQSIIPPAGSFNQSNGEADSELLEVEAELGDGAEQASQEAVPAQDNVGQTASTESSRATPETPTPEPGLQQLLEQAEALTIDGLVRPIGPRASDPLPRIRQMDFSELPADQTRYPGDPSRASTTATLGNTRRSGGRASINDIMQRAAQERQDMIEDLRRAHGYYFDVSAVSEVLLETADNYERADDVLTAMRQAADETRARASRRTESDGNDFRPAPGTRAAVVRRVQDEVEQVFETPRTVRRTRATVAAGLIRT
ncbi:hypothetical protein CALCODRAFT_275999 [Calocera cornea HHB12733]|uniref:Uncharacterized protein n=1 Tax=Calocera cornea HHB12733 TaxID=1353952 RepID=A0A165G380_9BASI|nr:hypothetical protein CALCODRAFT_275999 [Calocera cornea HHB12733]